MNTQQQLLLKDSRFRPWESVLWLLAFAAPVLSPSHALIINEIAIVALFAIALAFWFVIEYFVYGANVPGWATLVCSVMFFSGVQLLSIGILGEYVGRIFDEVKQRPVYIVGQEAGTGAIHPPVEL